MRDVYICDYVRTPIGRYGGGLSKVRADDLAAIPLKALATRNPDLNLEDIEEVWMGSANQAGEDNRNVARMALLLAGFPETIPGVTVNRLCASGLEAIASAARAIKADEIELAIAGGVESMSRAPFVMPKSENAFARAPEIFDTTIGWRFENPLMKQIHGTDSMPETAENVADDFGVSRADQDDFALASQQKAALAQAKGRFAREIVPVTVPQGRSKCEELAQDEHPRPQTDMGALTKLRPIVRADGTVTAGNSSGVNDGAAALILASEAAAKRNGLTPVARVVGSASAGVAPRIMGYGPVPAVRKLCRLANISTNDLGVIELNEAFASQALAVLRGLETEADDPRVNPNGGAIALGHPLGMSGARIAGSAALDLQNSDRPYAMATMCVGVGQGTALLMKKV